MSQPHKQQGVVLVIALLALLAISLASIALVRSVDTSNVVSGNMAFNEIAMQMSDLGAEQSYSEILGNLAANPFSCQNISTNCPKNQGGHPYLYPNVSTLDSVTKLPTPTGGLFWSDPLDKLPAEAAGYEVRYVVERMCGHLVTGGSETANMQEAACFAKCRATPIPDSIGTTVPDSGKLFYRVTVQVTGPRNTHAVAQYFYGVQDTVNDVCPAL